MYYNFLDFRLEYNSKNGCFHMVWLAKETPPVEGTFGWKTIVKKDEERKISLFCDLMDEQYHLGTRKPPSTLTIKTEWKMFDRAYSLGALAKNILHENNLEEIGSLRVDQNGLLWNLQ